MIMRVSEYHNTTKVEATKSQPAKFEIVDILITLRIQSHTLITI